MTDQAGAIAVSTRPKRLGVLATHPIQYHSPWFKHLANRLDLTVYYAHRASPADQARAGFGVEFEWDSPLLEGYEYKWLNNVSNARNTIPFSRYDTPELADIIDSQSFDAFLIFGWNYKSAWQAYNACKRDSIPTLMRGDSQLRPRRGALKSAVKRLLYPRYLPQFSGHLYPGVRNRDYLRHYGVPDERLFFAPHFVDVDYFRAFAASAERDGECRRLREELQIPKDAFVFSFVGKLTEKKRPHDFVRAVMEYARREGRGEIHALIVGDGPLRGRLERLAKDSRGQLHFVGFVNQSRLPAYYRMSDALVLPSGEETWGLVVNEAAACGIPAIVSEEAGCAPDLIDNRTTGFSFHMGDIPGLLRGMERIRVLRDAKPNLVSRALEKLSGRYSMLRATEGLDAALSVTERPSMYL